MTCHATGRRPRTQRIVVAAGPSGLSDDTAEAVMDPPKTRDGCLFLTLWIGGFAGGALYILWHVARAVWPW